MSQKHRIRRDQRQRWFVPGMVLIVLTGLSARVLFDRDVALAASPGQGPSGKEIFRFNTFGDEKLWTDQLRIHEVIESSIDPVTALSLGLKVDVDALPAELQQAILNGGVDLKAPATTVALLKLNAVVGLVGKVETIDGRDRLTEVGITCALCHSTVDNS